jgi:DNA-binding Lrp family transcriptional regulator
MATRVTTNDLLDALVKFGKAQARRPVGAWYTIEELAKRQNVSVPTVKYQMKVARERGVVIEQAYGTVLDTEGRAKRSTFYRQKP